ncbi:MAG TPA: homoserine kinase [Porticoccaceae bacterium]|nr:homoserine kinase [Porticoccaceae bacterium]
MAVYTQVSEHQLQVLLNELGQGRLLSWSGVADGLENSTYFLTCEDVSSNADCARGRRNWVLSILEQASPRQIEFTVVLMRRLHGAGLPVPELLVHPGSGRVVHTLVGKPALLSERIEGRHPGGSAGDRPGQATPEQCAAIGDFLGRMHKLGSSSLPVFPNVHGLSWVQSTLAVVKAELTNAERMLLDHLVARQADFRLQDPGLPVGAIHADLFRDNTLFRGDHLSAVIDFYSACIDWLLLDVAIVINDWACDSDGAMNAQLCASLLDAYRKHRPFTEAEARHWQDILCFAAMQFCLSRLMTRLEGRAQEASAELSGREEKDPGVFARILKSRADGVLPLPV